MGERRGEKRDGKGQGGDDLGTLGREGVKSGHKRCIFGEGELK